MKNLIFLMVLLFSLSSFAEQLEFHWGSEKVKTLQKKDFEAKSKEEQIYNPFRKYSKKYRGQDFYALLDEVYGEKWREADSIRFMALDGFVQSAPIKKMLEKGNDHQGLLAYGEENKNEFASFEKNGKMVNPGPFYLVWSNYDGRSVANYNDFLKWPYQLKSITIIRAKK